MWRLFTRKKSITASADWQQRTAEKIAGGIVKRQRRLADWLQYQSEKFTIRQKKIFLIVIMAVAVFFLFCPFNIDKQLLKSTMLHTSPASQTGLNNIHNITPTNAGKLEHRLDSLSQLPLTQGQRDSLKHYYQMLEQLKTE